MNFLRTISRTGEKEDTTAPTQHETTSSSTATTSEFSEGVVAPPTDAAVVPFEDSVSVTDDNNLSTNNDNNNNSAAVVWENPMEIEERKVAAAGDGDHQDGGDEEDDSEGGDSEDEDEYEYEDDEDEAAYAGFLDQPLPVVLTKSLDDSKDDDEPTKIEEDEPSTATTTAAAAPKWREPSREAVTMSLRAEKEKSGSKRRLAQDLYRIMNKDTSETGFLLEPAVEDQMDVWKISLFQFDQDSMLAKDLKVLGLDSVELEMTFPEQYPFSPPFVRVVRPRFKRQTGFVMNGALCMELLTSDGWNPVNDIESVIVSIRSLLVVGEGRLEAAASMSAARYEAALNAADAKDDGDSKMAALPASSAAGESQKRQRTNSAGDSVTAGYSVSEAKAAYEHLSSYHKKKGWDQSGWWARKG
jgi:ubiquitin-conjugating enzyme E2 Q